MRRPSFRSLLVLLCAVLFIFAASNFQPVRADVEFEDDEFEVESVRSQPAAADTVVDDLSEVDVEDDTFDDNEDDVELMGDESNDAAASADAPKPSKAGPPPRTWHLEAVGVTLVFMYIAMYFSGRTTNQSIANAWYNEYHSLFTAQFTVVGIGSNDGPFMKESQNVFKFYASGRRCCLGFLATLDLKMRHDLLSTVLSVLGPRPDLLTIDIPIDDMQPFVFAVVRASERKTLHKESRDLNDYTSLVASPLVPEGFEVLTDCKSVVTQILTPHVEAVLRQHAEYLQTIHFTDQAPLSNVGTTRLSKNALRFQFILPPPEKMGEIRKLMEMTLHLVDSVSRIRLSDKALKAAKEKRLQFEKLLAKQAMELHHEAIQQRKAEQKAKAREDLKSMSREEQRKYDEKERKKQAKKAMGSRMRTKVMR